MLSQDPCKDLVKWSRIGHDRRIEAAWIWRVAAHPRVKLFLWMVVWDRLLICMHLRNMGMEILIVCLIYRMEDEFHRACTLLLSESKVNLKVGGLSALESK